MIFGVIFLPDNLLIIVFQLIKFEAPSCDIVLDILTTKLHYNHLKGA